MEIINAYPPHGGVTEVVTALMEVTNGTVPETYAIVLRHNSLAKTEDVFSKDGLATAVTTVVIGVMKTFAVNALIESL